MARYYLHLRDGTEDVPDVEGANYDTVASLKEAMVRSARDVIAGDVLHGLLNLGLRIDAETGDGRLIATLPFRDVVEIKPEKV